MPRAPSSPHTSTSSARLFENDGFMMAPYLDALRELAHLITLFLVSHHHRFLNVPWLMEFTCRAHRRVPSARPVPCYALRSKGCAVEGVRPG